MSVLAKFPSGEHRGTIQCRGGRFGLALEPSFGIELGALRCRHLAIDRRAGADQPEMIDIGIAKRRHEKVVGQRIFLRPFPQR